MAHDRRAGRPARKGQNALPAPEHPVDFDKETPKFCLRHLEPDYDVYSLPESQRARFAMALQDRAQMTWQAIKGASRHGHGTELIPAKQIKRRIPEHFADQQKFMVLRYDGNLPMIGVRVRDVFQVVWIEAAYGMVYNHE